MKRTAVFLALLIAFSAAYADHPSSVESPVDDDGLIKSKSFKTNLIIYRSIGGSTEVKGKEKKRKWWCVWLCKRRVNKDAESIIITNTYYSEVSPGVFAVLERNPKTCTNTSSCRQREWAFGVGVKLTFPDGGASPTTIGGLLPVDGVITQHSILVDGQSSSATTAAGKHPDFGPVIVN